MTSSQEDLDRRLAWMAKEKTFDITWNLDELLDLYASLK